MSEFVKFVVKVFVGAGCIAAGGKLIKNGLENASRVCIPGSQNNSENVDNQ